MAEDSKKDFMLGLELPSPSDLRGRQSVRATFRLSIKAIEAMSIASVHLGIKQKSLFDHLIEDADALEIIARELQSEAYEPERRIQKTFVLSRKTLLSLDKACKRFKAPRDALVELSIQRLIPLIEKEKEKHHRRKDLLENMKTLIEKGTKILDGAHDHLGPQDPVFERMAQAMQSMITAYNSVKAFVEKGEVIEDF
jgi:hypothetical protein